MEETIDTILSKLKIRLHALEQSANYENNYFKANINGIWIAVHLFEISQFTKRKISVAERRWFEGGYQIARLMDSNEDRDIALLYHALCDEAEKHFEVTIN